MKNDFNWPTKEVERTLVEISKRKDWPSALEQFVDQKNECKMHGGNPAVCVVGTDDYDSLIGECLALLTTQLRPDPNLKQNRTVIMGVTVHRCLGRQRGFYFGESDP